MTKRRSGIERGMCSGVLKHAMAWGGLLISSLAGVAQEGRPRGTGAAPPDESALMVHAIELERVSGTSTLPAEVDLSRFLPVAGDQMGQSSCTGWALGYGWCTFTANRLAQDTSMFDEPMNPDRVFSPAFIYDLARDTTQDCFAPVMLTDAIAVLSAKGCCLWRDLPYDDSDSGCDHPVPATAIAAASGLSVGNATRLLQYDVAQLRTRLAEGDPIIINARIDTGFASGGEAAGGRGPFVWQPRTKSNLSGHAMLCVGYRDADSTFLVFNSWGRQWGDRRYLRIPYTVMRGYVTDAFWLDRTPLSSPLALAPPGLHPSGARIRLKQGLFGRTVKSHRGIRFHVAHVEIGDTIAHIAIRDSDSAEHLHTLEFGEGERRAFYHEGHRYTLAVREVTTSSRKSIARVRYSIASIPIHDDPVLQGMKEHIRSLTGSVP